MSVHKETPEYKPDEETKKYILEMNRKIKNSKDQRERSLPIFDGQDYVTYYKDNESIASTNLKKGEISTGTVETKLNAVVSEYAPISYLPDVEAFDENNFKDIETAGVYEDAIIDSFKKEYGDGDISREKKIARWSELLIQGTVITQDIWKKRYGVKKEITGKFFGDIQKWEKTKKTYEKIYEGPELSVVSGLSFFFGDIRKRYMHDQPYIFSYDKINYADAKALYNDYENFKYVIPGKKKYHEFSLDEEGSTKTTITQLIEDTIEDDEVEVLKFECDKMHGNHFQVFINGVPMFPIDFPLEAITENGMYSYTVQTLGFSKYVYGKSFVAGSSVKQIAAVSDLFLKLMIRKTKKSMDPPYANTGNRRYSARMLNPGMLNMISDPDVFQRMGDYIQGPSNGEFAMFEKLQELTDNNTVSNLFQGQEANKVITATEANYARQRAAKALALIEFSIESLEIKIAYRRLAVLNKYWFKPLGKKPITKDGVREIGGKYRTTQREIDIAGRGSGLRITDYMDGDLPSQEEVDELTGLGEKKFGHPLELVFTNPKTYDEIKRTWYINVYRKPDKGDISQKAELREDLQTAILFANMGIPMKSSWLKEKQANANDTSVDKMFESQPVPQAPGQTLPGVSNQEGIANSQNIIE